MLTLTVGELFHAHPIARIQGIWINLVVVISFHVKRNLLGIVKGHDAAGPSVEQF